MEKKKYSVLLDEDLALEFRMEAARRDMSKSELLAISLEKELAKSKSQKTEK
jgi:hypothetical protein